MYSRLYRPVGLQELILILEADARAFPPRLSWQPIFYPVLNFEYAAQIAKEWNQEDEFSGYAGFVTSFEVNTQYLNQFEVQTVGGAIHQELWIPAEDLEEFNKQIQGHIQVIKAYYGSMYEGKIKKSLFFENLNAWEQIKKLQVFWANLEIIRENFVQEERVAIQINFNYWNQSPEYQEVLENIKIAWDLVFPEQVLKHGS